MDRKWVFVMLMGRRLKIAASLFWLLVLANILWKTSLVLSEARSVYSLGELPVRVGRRLGDSSTECMQSGSLWMNPNTAEVCVGHGRNEFCFQEIREQIPRLNIDLDGDGLALRREILLGTSDYCPDFDNDGVRDIVDTSPNGGVSDYEATIQTAIVHHLVRRLDPRKEPKHLRRLYVIISGALGRAINENGWQTVLLDEETSRILLVRLRISEEAMVVRMRKEVFVPGLFAAYGVDVSNHGCGYSCLCGVVDFPGIRPFVLGCW